MVKQIYLPEIVGRGYADFWHFKGRYRVVKGSRASKKSKTTALWHIYNMMKHPGANLLVLRATYNSLKDSCFSDLKWAMARLGVESLWQVVKSPLTLIYKPTGQKILFRGVYDAHRITSITAEKGALCWA